MITHTSVTELLRLTLRQFVRVYCAAAALLEKRKQ